MIAVKKLVVIKALTEDVDFAAYFVNRLAMQVRDLRTQLELRNIRSAEERVLAALRLHADEQTGCLMLTTTWKLFADEIGITHEALYRTLGRLDRGGRIERDGARVRIIG